MHKVIIIEDDFHIGQLMKGKINEMNAYQCDHIFSNPVDFFNQPIQASIYLLDIVMPKMNGLDAIKKILELYPDSSIIINSIKEDSDTIFKALQLGAIGYIDKQNFHMDYKEVFTAIEDDGAYMTPKIARKVMAYFQLKENKLEKLTKRELEITHSILDGLSYKLVADRHNIAIDSVRSHIKNIYKKLNINSKSELFNILKR
jgi:DNA-binding NarL/FixJ family response regulator